MNSERNPQTFHNDGVVPSTILKYSLKKKVLRMSIHFQLDLHIKPYLILKGMF